MSLQGLDSELPAPKPEKKSSRFWKVLAVAVVLIVAGGIFTWYSSTPGGNLEMQQISRAYNDWAQSLAPPTPTIHPGLIHPAQGPNESVFFFAATAPTVGVYAMERGDTMFSDSLTIYAFTPLSQSGTKLTLNFYSPLTVYVKNPGTNFTSIETRYTILNGTVSVTIPPLASFDQENVDLPVAFQTQLVNVTMGGQVIFQFYHRTLPSYLAAPPSTQGELFTQTEEYMLGTIVVAGLALSAAAATARRTGYIPSMGRWGWTGAVALVIAGFGIFYEYQAALTINTVPYTYLPSFVGFYFLSLQFVRPSTYTWLFEMIEASSLTPSQYVRSLEIIPSSVDEGEPKVATDSWRDFARGRYAVLRFIKEERELEKDDDSFENERVLIESEYWYFDVPNAPGYRVFKVKEHLQRVEEEDDLYYRVVLAMIHTKDVEEFLSDLRTVESISQQKHELTIRNRWLRNNVISSANVIVSRIVTRLMGTTPSRRILNQSKFTELVESGMSKADIEKAAGAEKKPEVGKEGTAPSPEGQGGDTA